MRKILQGRPTRRRITHLRWLLVGASILLLAWALFFWATTGQMNLPLRAGILAAMLLSAALVLGRSPDHERWTPQAAALQVDQLARPSLPRWAAFPWLLPAVLTGAALVVALQLAQNDRARAQDTVRAAALQSYYGSMTALLRTDHLGSAAPQAATRSLARARTLAVLPQLDADRKAQLIRFLQEASLLRGTDPSVPLPQADLRFANLTHADLRAANLHQTDLTYANLTHANLTHANLSFAILQQATLSFATLSSADLSNVDLSSARLSSTDLHQANLSFANLTNTHFINANLHQANLTNARLRFTDLQGADLQGADLSQADLYRAHLQDATYDSETHWPPDFDPHAAGAKLVSTP